MRPLALHPLLLLSALAAPAFAQDEVFVEGEPLPDLELPTIDGTRTLNLAELRGTPTLLIQFASW